jgi:hypothetical protein
MIKIRITIIISFLLFQSLIVSSFPFYNNIFKNRYEIGTSTLNQKDIPIWALGNFSGRWGINIWGEDWFTIGTLEGYYGHGFYLDNKFSRFFINYSEYNVKNFTLLSGYFFGPYLFGFRIEGKSQQIPFVGLGSYNETHFRWRIIGFNGPTLFMKGIFSKFK